MPRQTPPSSPVARYEQNRLAHPGRHEPPTGMTPRLGARTAPSRLAPLRLWPRGHINRLLSAVRQAPPRTARPTTSASSERSSSRVPAPVTRQGRSPSRPGNPRPGESGPRFPFPAESGIGDSLFPGQIGNRGFPPGGPRFPAKNRVTKLICRLSKFFGPD